MPGMSTVGSLAVDGEDQSRPDGAPLPKEGVAEKYVSLVQDLNEDNVVAMHITQGMTDGFTVEKGLHQRISSGDG